MPINYPDPSLIKNDDDFIIFFIHHHFGPRLLDFHPELAEGLLHEDNENLDWDKWNKIEEIFEKTFAREKTGYDHLSVHHYLALVSIINKAEFDEEIGFYRLCKRHGKVSLKDYYVNDSFQTANINCKFCQRDAYNKRKIIIKETSSTEAPVLSTH